MVELLQSQKQGDVPPLVTVAMPVYNAGQYLPLAVHSIVRQTFPNWELLIIDDGSTDNSLQSIADIDDPRVRILRDGKNKGLAARLNECIDLARGKYFARMDQDDVSYPERFLSQIGLLNKHPEIDLVAVRAITIDENNRVTGAFPYALSHDEICARPWMGFHFPHPTWMGRIEWFRKHRYAEPGPYFCEDQELLLRSYRESIFATVGEVLFAYRVRGKVDRKKLAKTRQTVLKIQLHNFASSNSWRFALLAMTAFIVKLSSDISRQWCGFQFRSRHAIKEDQAESKWHSILNTISQTPTAL